MSQLKEKILKNQLEAKKKIKRLNQKVAKH